MLKRVFNKGNSNEFDLLTVDWIMEKEFITILQLVDLNDVKVVIMTLCHYI